MPTECENCKANPVDILKSLRGSDLSDKAKLVAILEAFGVTDREQVESILEAKPSTVRQARQALKIQRQKSSAAENPAPEIQRSAEIPAQTPEIQRQKSSDPSRAHATKESLRDTSYQDNRQTDSREVSVSQSAFNQTSENLIADAARWMNSDRSHAVKWLTTMIGIAGPEAVLAAYAQLLESQSKGKLIADPIRYIGKTAPTLKGKAQPKAELEIDGKPFRVTGHRFARPREEVMGNA